MLKFYVIGVLATVLLLILLAIYEKKKGNSITQFPASIIISILSWIAVIMLLFCYKDVFICPKNKNDKL